MTSSLNTGLRTWREASVAPLKVRVFRILWTAALISNVGAAVQATAASWTMATMSNSASLVALVQTAAMLPIVLLALPAGALADSIDRRALMLGAQVLGAVAAATLGILSFFQLLSPWSLLSMTGLIGAAVALHQPAWQASVIDLVPRAHLPAAISLNVLAFNSARSLGPVIGGFVIATAGAFAAFAVNALSFTGLIIALLFVRFPPREVRLPPEPILQSIGTGLRFVALSPPLRRAYFRAALFGFGASALYSLMPLLAHTRFPGGPLAFGLIMASLGVGSLAGALAAAALRARFGNQAVTNIATLVFGIAAIGAGLSTLLPAVVAFALLAGVSWIIVFTTTRTCIQLCSPRWVVGRAVSLGQVAGFGAMSVGAAFWGFLASATGLTEVLVASGLFLVVSLAFARLVSLPEPSLLEQEPQAPRTLRPAALPMDSRTGPVTITIEYHVPAEQTGAFLRLAGDLGRIRRRNGAIDWTLHQDVDRPTSWIEHILSRSWLDLHRRLERYTPAERELARQVDAFRLPTHPLRRLVSRAPDATSTD
jgi:MFS family permease